jgi:hypothetical protein
MNILRKFRPREGSDLTQVPWQIVGIIMVKYKPFTSQPEDFIRTGKRNRT